MAEDSQIEATFAELGAHWDGLDGLVHSIGFAPREAIAGDFLDGLSREAFRVAHDISAYSFPAMAKAALPLMQGRNASVLTLTYLGAERVVPNHNTMGLAKASLEASVRYLATALGRAASAPTASRPARSRPWPPAASRTLGHPEVRRGPGAAAPQRHHRGRGNVAAFLLSDLAAGVTGEITHVDAGFSTVVRAWKTEHFFRRRQRHSALAAVHGP